jgi:hypothetical protein
MLLATWSLSRGITWMDSQLSARGVITAGHMGVPSLRSADVFVYDLPRGIRYGLNFYLQRELPEWTTGARGLVFSSWKGQSTLRSQGYACEPRLGSAAAILCKPQEGLPAHAPGSGQPQ